MVEISFRPLRRADFGLLRDWLNQPHVAAWWGAGSGPDGLGGAGPDAATLEQVVAAYAPSVEGTDPTRQFVIVVDHDPAGLIQTYRLEDHADYAAAIGEPVGAGLDLLLGVPDQVGRGLGPRVIDHFVTTVVFADPGRRRCVAGPDVRNARSILAFAKAGFRWVRDATVPGEPAPEHVMVRSADAAPDAGS